MYTNISTMEELSCIPLVHGIPLSKSTNELVDELCDALLACWPTNPDKKVFISFNQDAAISNKFWKELQNPFRQHPDPFHIQPTSKTYLGLMPRSAVCTPNTELFRKH